MPEIGEVARIVHYLRKHLVGRTIESVKTQHDEIVYGKTGTSAQAFEAAMKGKKVVDARQQGKYFWLLMSTPPHPLLHLGMTGWMKFSNDDTTFYKPVKPEKEQWPPRFWKFILQLKGEPKCEVAFVDARRLGRIRLIDVQGDKIRNTYPLKRNGPDPVLDKDILTVEWLREKLGSKKIPVKALLLDQGNISGIGNWVGDEILYQAKIHPEQYSNTFDDTQTKQLHDSLIHVCTTAVNTLSQPEDIPDDWLVKYRWSKRKKDKSTLPNGMKIMFLTVGGRTSAVVPEVQKKTEPLSADIPTKSHIASEIANDTEEKVILGENEKVNGRKRTASRVVMPSKRPKGNIQSPTEISDAKELNYDTMKSMLKEELKRDLKEELLYELKQELRQEMKLELKQTRSAKSNLKPHVSHESVTTGLQSKSDRDIVNNVAVSEGSRRRSARLSG